jgi:hypothetical protein
MLKYCRGLQMILAHRFQYTSLLNMERFPVQSHRENGLVLQLQVDAYSIPLKKRDNIDPVDLFHRNMSRRIYEFQSRVIKMASTRIKY